MLIGKDIYKAYGENTVLSGVSTTIAPGQITVLIGPSGSGKSTFLRALSLLDSPDKGNVEVDEITYVFPVENGNGQPTPPWPKSGKCGRWVSHPLKR